MAQKYDLGKIVLIHKFQSQHPIVAIELFIKVGSLHEPKEKSGITNLVQSTILKGTKSRTAEDIAIEIESIGGTISAHATEDYSKISVAVLSKHYKKALEILFDVLLNPTFPEDEVEKEKKAILAGIKTRKDYIFNVAKDELMAKMYGEHPYSRLVSGSEETIEKLTRDDVISWHRSYFGSPNILIVVVGDVKFKHLKRELDKYINAVPDVSRVSIPEHDIILKSDYVSVKSEKFKQSYLMFGFLAPSVSDEDYVPLKLLDAYIGGGMSSELFKMIREEVGFAYEVDGFFPSRVQKSHFVIYFGLDKENIPEAKRRVESLLNGVKKSEIPEEKLNEVKRYLKGIYLLQHQTYASQAHFLGWWEVLSKGYEYDTKYINEIMSLTSKDLVDVANKYLDLNNSVIVEITPK